LRLRALSRGPAGLRPSVGHLVARAHPSAPRSSLSTTIKSIQDIMRKDVGVDGDAQRIGQLVWLLFLKIWDDREQELELMEDGYVSRSSNVTLDRRTGKARTVAEDLRWRAWAAPRGQDTGDKLLDFVNDTLFAGPQGHGARPVLPQQDPAAEALRRVAPSSRPCSRTPTST
jgi:hypothetical protein